MKRVPAWRSKTSCLVVVWMSWGAQAAAAQVLSPEGVKFVERVRQLADETDLFDVAGLQRALAVRLVASTPVREQFDCEGDTRHERRTVSWRPVAGGWYARRPSGAGDVQLPAGAINPATTTGEPLLSVESMELDRCGATARDHRRVTVNFMGLPAYACITAAQVRELIPAARRLMATDGYAFVHYAVKRAGQASVDARFAFRFGTDCAVWAEVTQEI